MDLKTIMHKNKVLHRMYANKLKYLEKINLLTRLVRDNQYCEVKNIFEHHKAELIEDSLYKSAIYANAVNTLEFLINKYPPSQTLRRDLIETAILCRCKCMPIFHILSNNGAFWFKIFYVKLAEMNEYATILKLLKTTSCKYEWKPECLDIIYKQFGKKAVLRMLPILHTYGMDESIFVLTLRSGDFTLFNQLLTIPCLKSGAATAEALDRRDFNLFQCLLDLGFGMDYRCAVRSYDHINLINFLHTKNFNFQCYERIMESLILTGNIEHLKLIINFGYQPSSQDLLAAYKYGQYDKLSLFRTHYNGPIDNHMIFLRNLIIPACSRMIHTLGASCSICIETILNNNCALTLNCGHSFHDKCIEIWAYQHNTCPLCRKAFRVSHVKKVT